MEPCRLAALATVCPSWPTSDDTIPDIIGEQIEEQERGPIVAMRRIGTWKDTVKRFAGSSLLMPFPGGWRIVSVLAHVDGYLLPHEGLFLYWLARCAPGDGAVVEVGALRGRSTLCLAAGVADRGSGKVVAIDANRYKTNEELIENLAHFKACRIVHVVPLESIEVAESWRDPVRFCFIDGDHKEDAVRADVESWLPHLSPGGFLALHDSTGPRSFQGPRTVAAQLLIAGKVFDKVGRIGSITYARRQGGETNWSPPEYGRVSLEQLVTQYGKHKKQGV